MKKELDSYWHCLKKGIKSSGVAGAKYAAVRVLQIILPISQLYVLANTIEETRESQFESCDSKLLIYAILLAVIIGLQWVSASFMYSYKKDVDVNLDEAIGAEVLRKMGRMQLSLLEDKKTADLSFRVCEDVGKAFSGIMFSILDIIYIFARIASLFFAVLSTIKLAAILFVSLIVPLFFFTRKLSKQKYQSNKRITEYARKNNYYRDILCEKEFASERHQYNYADSIIAMWNASHEKWLQLRKKHDIRWYCQVQLGSIVTQVVCILVFSFILKESQSGLISNGLFIAFITSAVDLVTMMAWSFNYAIDGIITSSEFANEYITFMRLPEEAIETNGKNRIGNNNIKKVTIDAVSFSYKKDEQPVLRDISMILEAGKVYAIVGSNGAGKTTLIKLLLGFYQDYLGKIIIDGVELEKLDMEEYRSHLAVSLQSFGKYNMSIRDNLSFGRDILDQDMLKAIQLVGLNYLSSNNDILDLLIGNNCECGHELSGGEWQRICIARTLCHPGNIRIFDEPTASLDPVAEAGLYKSIINTSPQNITILITHRLGSIIHADHIFFLKNGHIIEQGTHAELIKNRGAYYEMFNMQKQWYI